MSNIIYFPTNIAMDRSTAERQIGEMVIFGTSDKEKAGKILLRSVLIQGWYAAENGVVSSFLAGNVTHSIQKIISLEDRPRVVTLCSDEVMEILNWSSEKVLSKPPAILLTRKQGSFFRPCMRCEKKRYGDVVTSSCS